MDIIRYIGKYVNFVERDDWEFAERKNCLGVVVILARTKDNEYLLVEQFRKPVNARVIEFPAGLYADEDKFETQVAAAERELLEETGYKAGSLTYLFSGPSSSGITDEIQHFYFADNCEKVTDKLGVDDEDLTLHVVPAKVMREFLAERAKQENTFIEPKVWLYFQTI